MHICSPWQILKQPCRYHQLICLCVPNLGFNSLVLRMQCNRAMGAGLRGWPDLKALDRCHCGPEYTQGADCASPGRYPTLAVRILPAMHAFGCANVDQAGWMWRPLM